MTGVVDRFLSALPRGEWLDIEVVSEPGGMMAARTDTVHATTVWVRDGGVPAYLKFILARGESAGGTTRRLAGRERLERVRDRLLSARGSTQLPVARLLEVTMLDDPPGLLIAMERVRTIHGVIESGGLSVALSRDVLRALDSECCDGWIHYDICPKNTAIRSDGTCVLIDPESMYPVDEIRVDVSTPAFKFHRTPRIIGEACQNRAIEGNLSPELARKKHDAELIVLAAECSLGLFGWDYSDEAVDQWCSAAPSPESVREFWRGLLLELSTGEVPSPGVLVVGLEKLMAEHPDSRFEQGEASPVLVPVAFDGDPNWSAMTNWSEMAEIRLALRRDVLTHKQLAGYRERLLEVARGEPMDRRWWDELLLVTLAYEKDPVRAIAIADEALDVFESDQEFGRKRQLARMWANG